MNSPRLFKSLVVLLMLGVQIRFASIAQDKPDAAVKAKDLQKIQEEVDQLRLSHDKLREDYARLREENGQLRKENQALRLLLAERIEPALSGVSSNQTNTLLLSSTNRLTPEAIQSMTNWLTASSGKRHNSHCRYYKTTAGRFCGTDEGAPCKRCGG
jgi:hypothetical protein